MSDIDASLEAQACVDAKTIERHLRLLHEVAASVADIASIANGCLTLASYCATPADGKPKQRHFAIGDWAEMTRVATEWASEKGRNVYVAPVINRPGLSPAARGGKSDVLANFGFVCEFDRDKGNETPIANLPATPTLIIGSSHQPAENKQAWYLLSEPCREPLVAEMIARGLAKAAGDRDGNGDYSHVWRVAGTLNWPKPSKMKRGRPNYAQRVSLDSVTSERRSTLAALTQRLEANAGNHPSAEMPKPKAKTERARANETAIERSTGWSGDHWNDDPLEVIRIMDALFHLPNNLNRAEWRRTIKQLADYFLGNDVGKVVAAWWSRGGSPAPLRRVFSEEALQAALARCTRHKAKRAQEIIDGLLRPGVYADFEEQQFDATWRDGISHPYGSIGGMFEAAKEHSWESGRGLWGLGRIRRDPKPLSARTLEVLKVAETFPPAFSVSHLRWVWLWRVSRHFKTSADIIRLAQVIARSINDECCFGWRSHETVAGLLGWPAEPGRGFAKVGDLFRQLERAGFVVSSDARQRGAHGRVGPSYTLSFPADEDWLTAIATDASEWADMPTLARIASGTPMSHDGTDCPLEHPVAATPANDAIWPPETPVSAPICKDYTLETPVPLEYFRLIGGEEREETM